MNLIAVDPGKSGGIAHQDACGNVFTYPMPETELDLVRLLEPLLALEHTTLYLEKVGGFAGRAQPGSAMFTFGWWASGPLWVAMCHQVRIISITPQKWQKLLSLGHGGDDRHAWKIKLKAEAQKRFPALNVTLKTADALLILEAAKILEKSP